MKILYPDSISGYPDSISGYPDSISETCLFRIPLPGKFPNCVMEILFHERGGPPMQDQSSLKASESFQFRLESLSIVEMPFFPCRLWRWGGPLYYCTSNPVQD